MTAAAPFYLQGNYAPVTGEVTAFDLPVEGALPPELDGLYVRNGPNPRNGDPGHWFLGDGMLHGVRLGGGRARWYRNRWVRTRYLDDPKAKLVSATGKVDHTVAKANTHVVAHAGHLYALVESSFPTEVTEELDTLGTRDFDGRLRTAFTAHPKRCPASGELHFFGYGFRRPFLTYHHLDRAGALVRSEAIASRGAAMMHDFALTARYAVFLDLPVVLSPARALTGHPFPFAWSDRHGARLGLVPRDGRGADVRWLEIEPCYVFHVANAFDDGNRVIVDAVRYEELWRGGAGGEFPPGRLHRFTVDPAAGTVAEEALDERAVEFPRVDPRRETLPYRYAYVLGVGDDRLLKYDLRSGGAVAHELGPGRSAGEGVLAPGGPGEDEGWVLAFVHDAASDRSELVVLDASRFDAPPIARVTLPQRVPVGFHGSFVPAAELPAP